MTHNENCQCANCQAKGKPIREVWLKSVTPEELSEIEIYDWLEGFGYIDSLAVQKYIRKYGFLLLKARKAAYEKAKLEFESGVAKFLLDSLMGETDYLQIKAERGRCFTLLNKTQPPISGGMCLDDKVGQLLELTESQKIDLAAALESRDADWARIKELETEVDELRSQIQNQADSIGSYQQMAHANNETIAQLKDVIQKLAKEK